MKDRTERKDSVANALAMPVHVLCRPEEAATFARRRTRAVKGGGRADDDGCQREGAYAAPAFGDPLEIDFRVPAQAKALVAGINSSADQLEKGVNENLRVFSYDDKS